jgi:hypothetical protein
MSNNSIRDSGGYYSEEEYEDGNNEDAEDTNGEADQEANNEAAEDTNNEGTGCNFEDGTSVNSVADLELINLKEMSIEEITRYHFPDREVACMFYNWYGCLHGFAARKSRVVRNRDGEVIQQTFLCHREGKREEKYINSTSRKKEHKPLTRCGCQAKMKVHLDRSCQRWYIKLFNDDHNHSFVEEKFERMLPAHRKMSEYDKYQMNSMKKSGISTTRIYGYFASQAGGYENVGYTKRDMYNEQVKMRGSRHSDAAGALDFLKGMCTRDDMFVWKHKVNADGTLKHLFWCDGASRMDYSIFGDVLAFDATYKKIKYNTPLVIFSGINHHNQSVIFGCAIVGDETKEAYIWLLENFLEAMGGKCPVSIITDGDLAMRNAIEKVFPEAHHRLCAWHLIRNATSNIKNPQFVQKFKHCLLGDVDVDVFERKWDELVTEFGLEENLWMSEMYTKRKMWATAHIRGKFFAGFRTTSRCEGLHSEFGKYVSVLTNLRDFLQQFFRWLNYMRYKEIQADFSSSFGEVVLKTQHQQLESSASKLYTKEIFMLVRSVLERACRCKIERKSQRGSLFKYVVTKYPRRDIEWVVSYCQSRLYFECTCQRLETLGIACEHLICVMIDMNIVNMPDCVVLHRWSKGAKDAVNASNANSSGLRNPAFITSYVTFVERCKRMVTAAFECGKPEYLRSSIEMVETQTSLLEAVGRGDEVSQSGLGVHTNGEIGNPPRMRRKGGGGAPLSVRGDGKFKRRANKCGLCGIVGHNRQSCNIRSESLLQSQELFMENFHYGDGDFAEDEDEEWFCNILMVRILNCTYLFVFFFGNYIACYLCFSGIFVYQCRMVVEIQDQMINSEMNSTNSTDHMKQ